MTMPAHEKLRFWRIARGLTQANLAEILGCGKDSISVFESGRWRMSKRTRKRLAVALNIPEEALMDESPDPLKWLDVYIRSLIK